MAVIGWVEYSCPHCKRQFGEGDILSAHSTGLCPGCNQRVHVDAEAALRRGRGAALLAVGVVSVGVLVWSAVLGALGIGDDFFRSRTWSELKLLHGIVPMLLLAVVVISTAGAALASVWAYARMQVPMATKQSTAKNTRGQAPDARGARFEAGRGGNVRDRGRR